MDDRLDIEPWRLPPEEARHTASAMWDAWLEELEDVLADLPPEDPSSPALRQYLRVTGAWGKV